MAVAADAGVGGAVGDVDGDEVQWQTDAALVEAAGDVMSVRCQCAPGLGNLQTCHERYIPSTSAAPLAVGQRSLCSSTASLLPGGAENPPWFHLLGSVHVPESGAEAAAVVVSPPVSPVCGAFLGQGQYRCRSSWQGYTGTVPTSSHSSCRLVGGDCSCGGKRKRGGEGQVDWPRLQ